MKLVPTLIYCLHLASVSSFMLEHLHENYILICETTLQSCLIQGDIKRQIEFCPTLFTCEYKDGKTFFTAEEISYDQAISQYNTVFEPECAGYLSVTQKNYAKLVNNEVVTTSCHIGLRVNLINIGFPRQLFPFLKESKHYRKIQLIGLEDGTLSQLANVLEKSLTISTVWLNFRSISFEAAKTFGKALKQNHTIIDLTFFNAQFTDTAVPIFKSLKWNETIRALKIHASAISDDVIHEICGVLQAQTGLEKLVIDNTEISEKGIFELSQTLETNQKLRALHLCKCKISANGIIFLMEILSSSNVVELDLSENELTVEVVQALLDQWGKLTKKIKVLNFGKVNSNLVFALKRLSTFVDPSNEILKFKS